MKRTLLTIALLIVAMSASAQNDAKKENSQNCQIDTTAINGDVRFAVENWTSDKGKTEVRVVATHNGETYPSAKTYAERAKRIKRFGGVPTYCIVTNKSGQKRIVVL